MRENKTKSILKIVITVILLLMILSAITLNALFAKGKTPKLFGSYVHIAQSDDTNPPIPKGSAVFARDSKNLSVNVNDVVLCKSPSGNVVSIRFISKIDMDENGKTIYYPSTNKAVNVESAIHRENIIAICNGYPQSEGIGGYITFTTSFPGLLVQLILPCLYFMTVIIKRFVGEKEDDYDDEDNAEEIPVPKTKVKAPLDGDRPVNTSKRTKNPLFDPAKDAPKRPLVRKKLDENFGYNDSNSEKTPPKAKEDTAQFRKQSSAESAFAARNQNSQPPVSPAANVLRSEMLKRNADAEKAARDVKKPSVTAHDNTLIISAADVENEVAPLPKKPVITPQKSTVSNKNSDIDELVKRSAAPSRPKSSDAISAMSVDDLLMHIENEKKKL